MFPPFFETMFWTVFILSVVFIVFWWVIFVIRMIKTRGRVQETASETQPVIREKEIIREIVKIRCPYCGNLYDEKLDKCPHCGGKKL